MLPVYYASTINTGVLDGQLLILLLSKSNGLSLSELYLRWPIMSGSIQNYRILVHEDVVSNKPCVESPLLHTEPIFLYLIRSIGLLGITLIIFQTLGMDFGSPELTIL